MNVGKGLHRESIDVDPNVITQGLKDAMSGGKLLMTDEQAQQTLTQLQAEVREQEEAKRKQQAVDEQESRRRFPGREQDQAWSRGSAQRTAVQGHQEGTGPKPTITDAVTCNYSGTLIDGKEFDSSYKAASLRPSRSVALSKAGPRRCS